jgi:hypothetical protein
LATAGFDRVTCVWDLDEVLIKSHSLSLSASTSSLQVDAVEMVASTDDENVFKKRKLTGDEATSSSASASASSEFNPFVTTTHQPLNILHPAYILPHAGRVLSVLFWPHQPDRLSCSCDDQTLKVIKYTLHFTK